MIVKFSSLNLIRLIRAQAGVDKEDDDVDGGLWEAINQGNPVRAQRMNANRLLILLVLLLLRRRCLLG